jgi:ABC-type glycerol-3-phosphate transport system substrate-binding protein
LTGFGAAAGAGVLSGCLGGGSPSANAGKANNSKTIRLMNWEALEGSPYPDVFKAFEKQTGYKINYEFGASGDAYWPKTRTVLGSNNPPDIMRIDDDFVAYYASTGKLLDLRKNISASKLRAGDYYPAVYDNGKQPDGSIVAWSLGIQPRVIFYNKTLFKSAGVPLPPTTWSGDGWSWDDFLSAAKKLTTAGKRWGAAVIDDSGYEVIFPANNGGQGRWAKDGSRFALSDAPDAQAVQWVADLTCKEKVQPAWSVLNQDQRGQQMFIAGQIAMMERGSSLVPFLQQNMTKFDWDIAPIPAGKAQHTYGNQIDFCIPAAAGNQKGAWKLLEYLTTMDGAKFFSQQGSMVPGLKKAAALIKPTGKPPQHIDLILDAVDNAILPGRVVQDEAAINVYRPALDPVKTCQTTASKALGAVSKQVDAIVGKK